VIVQKPTLVVKLPALFSLLLDNTAHFTCHWQYVTSNYVRGGWNHCLLKYPQGESKT